MEYWWPPTLAFEQNFNAPWIGNPVQAWLNWFVRAAYTTTSWSVDIDCQYCNATFGLNMNSHDHSVVARLPAIAPQAPKYIHFSDSVTADWNYPGRYSPSHLNPNSWHSITDQYSHTWIDAEWSVTLLAKSWLDESSCEADSHYTEISNQSGFSFWVNRIKWLRPDEVEIYP